MNKKETYGQAYDEAALAIDLAKYKKNINIFSDEPFRKWTLALVLEV